MVGVTRSRHAMAVVRVGVPGMSAGKRIAQRRVVLQHAYPAVGFETAHGGGECAACEPLTGGEWVSALVTRVILDHGRYAEGAAHGHAESRVGLSPDEPPHSLGVS